MITIKVLWFSNAPEPLSSTGYAVQTGLFAKRIAALGHDVVIAAMTGINGFPTEHDGIMILPSGLSAYSADILPEHARRFFGRGPGLVLLHFDVWAIGPDPVQGFACAAWSPVHSTPMSAGDRAFYALSGAQPIAYSRFGETQMRDFGLNPCYVPHGEDTKVFRPFDAGEIEDARREVGVPKDAFVLSMIAANKGNAPSRKAFWEQFSAFAKFRKRHNDAILLVHSMAATPDRSAGLDLRPMMDHLGIAPYIRFTNEYAQVCGLYGSEFVAKVAGCADVLTNVSFGEGFGLAALHAQACGVPVIVGDNSAQRELCGAGWKVRCQPYWQAFDQAEWQLPLIPEIVKAYEKAYNHAGDPGLKAQAREFALRYDADLVTTQYWKPVLEMLEQYAGAVPVRPPGGRLEVNAAGHPTGCYTEPPPEIPLPTAEVDGLKWIQRGNWTDDWIAVGHEEALTQVFDDILPQGGVFLDVGAHVGRWSLRLAAKASKVVAVEANPHTAAVLRAHIELNQITNVQVVEMAAWDKPARVRLEDPNSRVDGGSTRAFADDDGTVQAMPLDDVLLATDGFGEPLLDRLDAVKLDVEGADLKALAGMAGLLKRFRPKLLIEDHSIYQFYELRELTTALGLLGYRHRRFMIPSGGAMLPYLLAEPADAPVVGARLIGVLPADE